MNHDAKISLMDVTDEMNHTKSLAWAMVKALEDADSPNGYDGAAYILFERVDDHLNNLKKITGEDQEEVPVDE